MHKPPFGNQKELFIWGPVPLRNFYDSGVRRALGDGFFIEKYGRKYLWPLSVLLHRDGKTCWINDYAEVWDCGGRVFWDLIFPKPERNEIRKRYDESAAQIEQLRHTIDTTNLSSLSDAEFIALWNLFLDAIARFLRMASFRKWPIMAAKRFWRTSCARN